MDTSWYVSDVERQSRDLSIEFNAKLCFRNIHAAPLIGAHCTQHTGSDARIHPREAMRIKRQYRNDGALEVARHEYS